MSGTVRDTNNQGIAGARVFLFSCSGTNGSAVATQTAQDGTYQLTSPPGASNCYVSFDATRAKFKFTGTGATKGFQCALGRKKKGKKLSLKFSKCKSPKAYKKLKSGNYVFGVRGVSAAGPGPAAKTSFSI